MEDQLRCVGGADAKALTLTTIHGSTTLYPEQKMYSSSPAVGYRRSH